MSFNTPVQINYGEIAVNMVNMFVRLSQNMLNPDLVAGPPMIVANEPKIIQLYGQCPSTSGSLCTFTFLEDDLWLVEYDDGEGRATLQGPDVNKFFTGDY